MDYQGIPSRVILSGDKELAERFIGEGHSLAQLCKQSAAFQDLGYYRMRRDVTTDKDETATIQATVYGPMTDIRIHAEKAIKEEPKKEVGRIFLGEFWFYVRTEDASLPPAYQYFYFCVGKKDGGFEFKFKKNTVSHWEGDALSHPAVIPAPATAKLFYVSAEQVVSEHKLDTEEGLERFGFLEENIEDVKDIFYWVASYKDAEETDSTVRDFNFYRGSGTTSARALLHLAVAENFIYNFPYLYFYGGTWGNLLFKIRQLPSGYWEHPEPYEKRDAVACHYRSIDFNTEDISGSEEDFNANIVTQARIFNGGFIIYPKSGFGPPDVYDPWQWTAENLDDLKHIAGTHLIQHNIKTVTEDDTITWSWPNEAPGTVGYNFNLGFDPTVVLSKFYPVSLVVSDDADTYALDEWDRTKYSIKLTMRQRRSPEGADLVFLQLAGRWTGDVFHGYKHYFTSWLPEYDPTRYSRSSTFVLHRGFAAEGIVFAEFTGDVFYSEGAHVPYNQTFFLRGANSTQQKSFFGKWKPAITDNGPDIYMRVDGTNAGISYEIGDDGGGQSQPPSSSFEVTDQVVDAELVLPGAKNFFIDWKFSGALSMSHFYPPSGTTINQDISPSTVTDRLNASWPMGAALVGDILVFGSEYNTMLDMLKQRVNELRVEAGVGELTWEWRLDDICVQHSYRVWKTQDATEHESWADRKSQAQKAFPGLNTFGENAAWRNDLDAEGIIQQWLDSPGHKENMLRAVFTLGGMAVHIGEDMAVGVCNIFLGHTE